MENNKTTKESREEILERILEETARNPYKPGEIRNKPAKPVRKEYVQRTQVFSSAEAQAALMAEIEAQKRPKRPAVRRPDKPPETSINRENQPEPQAPIQPEPKPQIQSQVQPQIQPKPQPESAKPDRIEKTDQPGELQDKYAALEKINRIKREKAAAAKEAIKKKTELENAIRAQETAQNQTDDQEDKADENSDEKVNIFTPDDDGDYGYDYDDDYEAPAKNQDFIWEAAALFQNAVCIIFAVFAIFTQIFNFSGVSGESMQPTLNENDQLFVLDAFYKPSKGDIVIIDNKTSALLDENGKVTEKGGLDCKIVKRVIALGGDKVDIDFENGTVSVNDEVLEENYISEPTTRDAGAFEYPLTIPEGYAFVLGDNRNVSKDSRHEDVGLIPENEIIGKVIMRVYPFGSFGTVE